MMRLDCFPFVPSVPLTNVRFFSNKTDKELMEVPFDSPSQQLKEIEQHYETCVSRINICSQTLKGSLLASSGLALASLLTRRSIQTKWPLMGAGVAFTISAFFAGYLLNRFSSDKEIDGIYQLRSRSIEKVLQGMDLSARLSYAPTPREFNTLSYDTPYCGTLMEHAARLGDLQLLVCTAFLQRKEGSYNESFQKALIEGAKWLHPTIIQFCLAKDASGREQALAYAIRSLISLDEPNGVHFTSKVRKVLEAFGLNPQDKGLRKDLEKAGIKKDEIDQLASKLGSNVSQFGLQEDSEELLGFSTENS